MSDLKRLDWVQANALVKNATRIVILTHVNPDGDAIGSLRGLGHILEGQGKQVVCAVDGGTPDFLGFLPGTAAIHPNLNQVDPAQVDLVIITDCSDERRIGEVGKVARTWGKPLINVDHHRTNLLFGDAILVDSITASSTEMVLDWAEQAGWGVSPEAAECLLCGLVTDTLCFRTNSTTPVTLQKAQKMMTYGGDLSRVVQHTVSRIPTAVIRLWGVVMPSVRIENGVVWAKITIEADRETGAHGEDGGLPSLLLQADDASISCVITEIEGGKCELSMRAKPGFEVSGIALNLGGGGHKLAAGASVVGSPDQVEGIVIPLLKEAVKAGASQLR